LLCATCCSGTHLHPEQRLLQLPALGTKQPSSSNVCCSSSSSHGQHLVWFRVLEGHQQSHQQQAPLREPLTLSRPEQVAGNSTQPAWHMTQQCLKTQKLQLLLPTKQPCKTKQPPA
jgi:hypothetical protein